MSSLWPISDTGFAIKFVLFCPNFIYKHNKKNVIRNTVKAYKLYTKLLETTMYTLLANVHYEIVSLLYRFI